MNRKKILIIGGGEWQVPLVIKAKELGHTVICSNLYPDSPAFKFADISYVADILDKERNLRFAAANKPDAVVTDQSDIAVPVVAYICEQLGLPGIGISTAKRFTNKVLMRKIAQELGFPSPNFKVCYKPEDVIDYIDENSLPVVMKPPSSQSSRGVIKLDKKTDIKKSFYLAKEYSSDNTVLVEDYIGGIELTVDGIKTHTQHYCLATSCKEHYSTNTMVAKQLLFTQDNPLIDYHKLHNVHNRLIKAMGLPFGLTHAEYKYYRGEFYLIEVAARGGGTNISSDIAPLMSGIDTMACMLRMALGEFLDEIHPTWPNRFSMLTFFDFESGKIRAIKGFDKASELSGIIDIGLNIDIGDTIQPIQDDRTRHGHLIACANNLNELMSLVDSAKNKVEVVYE